MMGLVNKKVMEIDKVQLMEMIFLRRVGDVTLMKGIRSTQIRKDLRIDSIQELVENRELA